MSEFRQRAIEDVARELGDDPKILRNQMDVDPKLLCNHAEYKVYAVTQRERVLELEAELRLLAIAAHRLAKKVGLIAMAKFAPEKATHEA